MKGSPLVRLVLVIAALLAVLWPLRTLTSHHDSPQTPTAVKTAANSEVTVHMVLTSTTWPFSFEVTHLGKVIWKGDSSASSIAQDIPLSFPAEGIDLVLNAHWQEEKQTAIKLEVTPPDSDPMARTLWGTTQVGDVLTFSKP